MCGPIRAISCSKEESEGFKALRLSELFLIKICMCARLNV